MADEQSSQEPENEEHEPSTERSEERVEDPSDPREGTLESGPVTERAARADADADAGSTSRPKTGPQAEREPRGIRDRIASTLRDGNPVGAGAEMLTQRLGGLKDVYLPLITLVALVVLLITFRTVLLPFIFACILVYLMEPIVGWIGRTPRKSSGLPRWVAVILVYLVFIGIVTSSLVLVVPRFASEIVKFAETAPEEIQKFRTEDLPGINAQLQDLVRSYVPVRSPEKHDLGEAQRAVRDARYKATRLATATGMARRYVHHAASARVTWTLEEIEGESVRRFMVEAPEHGVAPFRLKDAIPDGGWAYTDDAASSAIVLQPGRDGSLRVDLRDVAIEVEQIDEGRWVVRQQPADSVPIQEERVAIEEMFNLERTLDDVLEGLASTSNERLGSLIEFAQKLVVGVVGVFVAIVLTLMVAAFMSIDLPRVMDFLRSLVPGHMRRGYDILLGQLDRGLAGVVRGQLLICVVNGCLTYVGLAFLGVKFSVLLAVVAGILSVIPVFGTILSTIPIVLIALTDGFMTGVLALGWILLIHAIEANILNPKIIGSSAHIHPVIVIFALLAGESAFGLVGALLAVPTASILLTLFNFVRTRAWKQAQTPEGTGASSATQATPSAHAQ